MSRPRPVMETTATSTPSALVPLMAPAISRVLRRVPRRVLLLTHRGAYRTSCPDAKMPKRQNANGAGILDDEETDPRGRVAVGLCTRAVQFEIRECRGGAWDMAEKKKPQQSQQSKDSPAKGATATAKPKRASKTSPKRSPPQMLPPWKVLLHNDDKNEVGFVVRTIVELTTLNEH